MTNLSLYSTPCILDCLILNPFLTIQICTLSPSNQQLSLSLCVYNYVPERATASADLMLVSRVKGDGCGSDALQL